MSPEVAGLIGLGVLVALLFARMWIGAAMAMVGFLGYTYLRGFDPALGVVGQIPFSTMSWYPMTAIPLFVFMGCILFQSGVGKDLYDSAYVLIGQLRGGLAMATVLACALFASITGVSGPAIVTMGKVAVPAMKKYNYDDKLALGSIVCAGTLAFLIPPSMVFIIYGILTQTSIGKLYMAGFIPGILLAGLMMFTIWLITTLSPQAGPAGPKTSLKEKVVSLKGVWPTLLLFLVVLGGIYLGVFTPTEGGAVGAFGALVITGAMLRLNFKKIRDAVLEATQTTALIMLLIIGAYILMKFLAVSKLTVLMGTTVAELPVPPMVIFAGIVLLYIILGMFLDIVSAVILTIPVIFPLMLSLGSGFSPVLGMDPSVWVPIWFGVIVVILIEMGLVTPPVGLDAFILAGAVGAPLSTVFRGVLPFLIAEIVCIVILVIFPQIALWLPSTM